MTSREIAELVESRHADVCISIERLMERGVITRIGAAVFEDINGLGISVKRRMFVFTGDQGRRDSIVVVAQLSPEFTGKLVDRWRALEARNTLPDFNNPVAAARAWADQVEARQLAEQDAAAKTLALTAAQPAIEFTERVAAAEDVHTLDEAAKILRAGPRKFRQWMRDERILRMDGTPYQEHMNRGLFRVIEKTIEMPHGFKLHAQTFVTGKGMIYLQRRLDHALMGATV